MNQPHLHKFFPTTVYSVTDNMMADKMFPIAQKYLSNKSLLTYQWGYKNTFSPVKGLEIYDDMNEFKDFILQHAENFDKIKGINPFNLKATIFASEMFRGDRHAQHPHPNSIYSGVFYLQVPENSSPIVFIDPRNHWKYVLPQIKEQNEFNSVSVIVKPSRGLLMLWDSWLEHMVPTNESVEGRITLVFNLLSKG